MKTSLSVAMVAGLALAGGDVGPWSSSKPVTLKMTRDGFANVWEMTVWSAFDEDFGLEYIRFKHELTADIKATDEVTFEVGFQSQNDPWTNKQVIAEDGAVCKLT